MKKQELFTEVDFCQQNKDGNLICGDSFMCRKPDEEGRILCVLSDGLGSGIKACVLSSLTATMAINYTARNEQLLYTARAILRALPLDREKQISYSTFCIADINSLGQARIIEYETPSFYLFRRHQLLSVSRQSFPVERPDLPDTLLYISSLQLEKEDRIVCFTDGITQSGMGRPDMPAGWGEKSAACISALIQQYPTLSARELSQKIVSEAVKNDNYSLKDDASCFVAYLRTPRNLLICSGPPFNPENDKYLAGRVKEFQGKKIICGGTTARILSRELQLPLHHLPDTSGDYLPPLSALQGFELVTEGILTLSKVERLLSGKENRRPAANDPAAQMVNLLHNSDHIHFLIGTCINIAHQDPSLPVELEIRRNVIRKIKYLLETKFLKNVEITYL